MTSARQGARLLLVVAVVAAGSVTLGRGAELGADRTLDRWNPQIRRASAHELAFHRCREDLRAGVPNGVRVAVDAPDDATYQRLVEVLTPWARVVARAEAVLAVGQTGDPDGCGGVGVTVARLR